jgi:ABC-type Fe3+/spermidine/putrescine transport system ATPase subunit
MSGVSIKNVTKIFGSVFALDNVSLEMDSGELVALLGPSGCGKTTLLRTVAGLEQPDKGVITISGKDVTNIPTRGRPIGMSSKIMHSSQTYLCGKILLFL